MMFCDCNRCLLAHSSYAKVCAENMHAEVYANSRENKVCWIDPAKEDSWEIDFWGDSEREDLCAGT